MQYQHNYYGAHIVKQYVYLLIVYLLSHFFIDSTGFCKVRKKNKKSQDVSIIHTFMQAIQ